MKSVAESAAVPTDLVAEGEQEGGGGDDSLLMFTEEDDEEFDPLKRTGSLSQRTSSLSGNKPTPPAAKRAQAPPLIPSSSVSSMGLANTGSGGGGLLGDLSGLDLSSDAQPGTNMATTSSSTNTVASLQEILQPLQASTLASSQQTAMLTSATPLVTQQTAQIQV